VSRQEHTGRWAIATIAVLLCAAAGTLRAQQSTAPTLLFGPATGFDVGLTTSNVTVYAGSPACGVFDAGHTSAPWLGGRLLLPRLFGNRLGLGCDLAYAWSTDRFSALPVDEQVTTDPATGQLIELDREYRLVASSRLLRLDIRALYPLSDRMRLSLGPSIGWRLGTTFDETDNVLGPGDVRLEGGQSSVPMSDGPTLRQSHAAFGAAAAIGYDLTPWPGRRLSTELILRSDLLSPASGFSWRTYSLGLGLSLLFDGTPRPPEPAAALPAPPAAPRTPRLTASIELYGVDENEHRLRSAVVHVYEVLYRQFAPFLPAIFFDRSSSDLPARYMALTGTQVAGFSPDSLSDAGVLKTYHQSLNVLGYRLRHNGSARITLIGSTSREEAPALALRRAESVRDYLISVWEIAPERIAIGTEGSVMSRSNEATEDGRAENRRVEILSSSSQITAPVMTERIARDFDPPMLRMNPVFEAEAGVRSWKITVSQNGQTIGRYTNDESRANGQSDLTWQLINDRLDSVLSPIVAELTVTDSAGGTVTARDQVPLSLERRLRVVDRRIDARGARRLAAYTLVAFDYNSSELGPRNEAVIQEIAAATADSERIIVTGYTDRIGDERHNAELSRLRAERVAEALRSALARRGVNDVTIMVKGAGVETERFENDLPEGRILSRGVSVVVRRGSL
jgi:outer membrane protein OmpA-like peptidoglycan-associated protein